MVLSSRETRASGGDPRTMTLFHGTSLESAERIQAYGFEESSDGKLGPGIYLASYTKVRRVGTPDRSCALGEGGPLGW
jgi:hypothetical protein